MLQGSENSQVLLGLERLPSTQQLSLHSRTFLAAYHRHEIFVSSIKL